MKISGIFMTLAFAAAMMISTDAMAKSGKVEAVENGGRKVTIAGKTYKISGSRTKVTIGGKEGDRGEIKVGMTCDAKGSKEAKTVDCK